ncbi:LOW QUALITY PROTEIN: testicular haploid expressed gene protein [Acomys russatus]|uniref:LOW QUALITY PROTEIN: testicular haploid expressed gene protein n=1 Tax=Acomys russatus TaxID=60746 RepID=UPI0021E25965|nr:LOW QUALITY PROTEIN: testicular haploid expressed gene protein [Acomys russatus]
MGELGEHQASLLNGPVTEAKASAGLDHRQSNGSLSNGNLGFRSASFESHWLQGSPGTSRLAPEDPEEEIPPEEVAEEELSMAPILNDALGRDLEVDVVEMSQLSINERTPSFSTAKSRRKRGQRLLELAKPKNNWQHMRDRPSVYWTERFTEDTTLTVTVPAVSRRVEELSRPKRFYLEYYNNNRTTPIWPIPRSTLEYQPSNRLKQLATPKIRNNIWSIDMSEVSQVSRAAQMAIPTPRTLQLAKPRPPATLAEEWDPMPKRKPYVSDYSRLLQLATPKAMSEKCVPDRNPQWEVLDVTKKAVASSRIVSLAQPRIRKDLNEGYNPYYISPASLAAEASPRINELATPKYITKKV